MVLRLAESSPFSAAEIGGVKDPALQKLLNLFVKHRKDKRTRNILVYWLGFLCLGT
jgi:hypothetical protein